MELDQDDSSAPASPSGSPAPLALTLPSSTPGGPATDGERAHRSSPGVEAAQCGAKPSPSVGQPDGSALAVSLQSPALARCALAGRAGAGLSPSPAPVVQPGLQQPAPSSPWHVAPTSSAGTPGGTLHGESRLSPTATAARMTALLAQQQHQAATLGATSSPAPPCSPGKFRPAYDPQQQCSPRIGTGPDASGPRPPAGPAGPGEFLLSAAPSHHAADYHAPGAAHPPMLDQQHFMHQSSGPPLASPSSAASSAAAFLPSTRAMQSHQLNPASCPAGSAGGLFAGVSGGGMAAAPPHAHAGLGPFSGAGVPLTSRLSAISPAQPGVDAAPAMMHHHAAAAARGPASLVHVHSSDPAASCRALPTSPSMNAAQHLAAQQQLLLQQAQQHPQPMQRRHTVALQPAHSWRLVSSPSASGGMVMSPAQLRCASLSSHIATVIRRRVSLKALLNLSNYDFVPDVDVSQVRLERMGAVLLVWGRFFALAVSARACRRRARALAHRCTRARRRMSRWTLPRTRRRTPRGPRACT